MCDGCVQTLSALCAGADEYVLLLADDYLAILDRLIHKHQQLAAQPALQQDPTSPSDGTGNQPSSISAAEAASIAATLKLFRDRVVPAWTDSSIPRATLLQLLRQPGQASTATPTCAGVRPAGGQQPKPTAAGASREPAHERHLLALDLLCRDSRSPDSYQLTVPGAAAFVKSVVSGRQELLQQLGRKK